MTSNDSFFIAAQNIRQLDLRTALPRYGIELKGRSAHCPFHPDRKPSFGIYQVKSGQRMHCLGCGWDGDLIQFVRDLYRLPFRDAVRMICADFQLPMPDKIDPSKYDSLRALPTEAQRRSARIKDAQFVCLLHEDMLWLADDILEAIPPSERTQDNEAYVDAVLRRISAERALGRAETKLYNLTHEEVKPNAHSAFTG